MERIPRPGELYLHFKNRLYQIVAVATHTETGERMVVYQALYGDFGIYVRPLTMFTEEVDREKYPDAAQRFRFELVTHPEEGKGAPSGQDPEASASQETDPVLSPLVLLFLDAKTCEEKLAVLQSMKGKVGQRELDSLYVALDLKGSGGTTEQQLDHIRQFLNTQQRFDASRLRRS